MRPSESSLIMPRHTIILVLSTAKLGRYQDAIEAFKQAIRIKPDDAKATPIILVIAYNRLGRHQEAIEAYKQAIKVKPDYAEAHYNLALPTS